MSYSMRGPTESPGFQAGENTSREDGQQVVKPWRNLFANSLARCRMPLSYIPPSDMGDEEGGADMGEHCCTS